MNDQPRHADDYSRQDLQLVKSGCLEIAISLNDLLEDMVVVGGVVPTLLIDVMQDRRYQTNITNGFKSHVGTQDIDLGFTVGILDSDQYTELPSRLKESGFEKDVNDNNNTTPQRWRYCENKKLKIDFLIPVTRDDEEGSQVKRLEGGELSAIVTPGLELAFEDTRDVLLSGKALDGSEVTEEIPVCGPGSFVLLKALACKHRGKPKDKYDLVYMIRNYKGGAEDVAECYQPFLEDDHLVAEKAVEVLEEYFGDTNGRGPNQVSLFLHGSDNENTRADAAAFVGQFLDELDY